MAKPELGTKRLCAHCGAKFYDLSQYPDHPARNAAPFFEAVVRADASAAGPMPVLPPREVEAVLPETQEAEFVSLEDADAEGAGQEEACHGGGGGGRRGCRARGR